MLELFTMPCNHKTGKFQCQDIPRNIIKKARENVYAEADKVKQDTKLSHLIETAIPKRKRSRKIEGQKHHKFTLKYNIRNEKGHKFLVCQKMFLAVFDVSQKRVQNIANRIQSGNGITEKRGGDRKSHKTINKRCKVMDFIRNLKGRESHYNRSKSRRIYLDSQYNITVLHKLYNKSVDTEYQVNYKFFSRIFNNAFNIGFGTPASDVCGFCVRHQNQISICKETTEIEKLKLTLKVHKMRGQQFYKLMKDNTENSMSLCFDMQQVQVLPKTPIGDAFYSQQLSFYAFCVTDIACKTPVFYTWLEHQAGRGCTEVGSALYDFFNQMEFPENVTDLRLFSDGCAGQNKNNHIIHMLMIWLNRKAPPRMKTITMFFPVRGHSYMPADRVFGRVEKLLRAHTEIKSPEKYREIYVKVGQVKSLGKDWKLIDIKHASHVLKKIEGISEAKRIIIKKTSQQKVVVKPELFYRNDDPQKKYVTLLQRGKKLNSAELPDLNLGRKLKEKKIKSLRKLLTEMATADWSQDPQLEWLVPVLENNSLGDHDSADQNGGHESGEECICNEEDGGVKV